MLLLLPSLCFGLTIDGLVVNGLNLPAKDYLPFTRPVFYTLGASVTTGSGSSGTCKMGFRDDIQAPGIFGRHFEMVGPWGEEWGDGGGTTGVSNRVPNNTTQPDTCADSALETPTGGWGGAASTHVITHFLFKDYLNTYLPPTQIKAKSVILIDVGANDLSYDDPPDNDTYAVIWSQIETLIDAVVAHDSSIYIGVLEITPRTTPGNPYVPDNGTDAYVVAANAYVGDVRLANKIVANDKIFSVPIYAGLSSDWENLSADNFHPNDDGYAAIALGIEFSLPAGVGP